MATSLLIPAQQSTSNVGGGVFVGHTADSPPLASIAENTTVVTGGVHSSGSKSPQAASTAATAATERRKKKPYKELTLEEKVQLIRLAEENAGLSQASIAERYAIAKSNVCRILQRKHEYLRAFECAGFAGSRKRKLRGDPDHHQNASGTSHIQEARPSTNQQRHLPMIPAPKPRYCIPTTPLKEANELQRDVISDNCLLQNLAENHFGNETLRAHMYKQHQISRMFMCRCCNWAFPDKTSLHMHMQAKEEGKTISVPVIGKGNPPAQQQNTTPGHGAAGAAPQAPTLHVPQARAPAQNPFAPLQLHTLAAHQPLNITDPNALQAAAATLFPQMALLRGATPNSSPADELMSKLRERLMLNNLVAQSGFGLAAWLASFPKVDQSGLGSVGATNSDILTTKEESVVDIGDEDDEINVDKEVDEEMPLERARYHNDDHIDICEDVVDKEDGKQCDSHVDDAHESGENKECANESRIRPDNTHLSGGSATSDSSVSPPTSNTMPNLRSAINASPLNNLIYKKRLLDSPNNINDALLNIAAPQPTIRASEQSPDGQDSHVSPAETNSSISSSTESSRECYECSVYKGKLAVAENRCRYLEGRTATLQSDALRFSTRVSVSENSARQFEHEGRVLREQNELLQRKLLECQEKTLAFMQGDQATNPQAIALYLNDILKTTFLR